MCVIRTIFISSGKIPWAKELLNIYRSGSNLKSKTSVTWKEISSWPGLYWASFMSKFRFERLNEVIAFQNTVR